MDKYKVMDAIIDMDVSILERLIEVDKLSDDEILDIMDTLRHYEKILIDMMDLKDLLKSERYKIHAKTR